MCQRCLDFIPTRLIATCCKNLGFPHTFNGYPAENDACTTLQDHHNLHFTGKNINCQRRDSKRMS